MRKRKIDDEDEAKKGSSSTSHTSSPTLSKLSCHTPKSTLSATPRTPPSPVTTNCDGLTPPSPLETHDVLDGSKNNSTSIQMEDIKNSNNKIDRITPPSPSAYFQSEEPQTKRIKIHRHKKLRAQPQQKSKQLYLDFGQSSFGSRTICNVCNMLYVHGVKEDEENHKKICSDYLHGVSFNMWKHARIVLECSSKSKSGLICSGREYGCIVEVKESDSLTLRKKVLQVKNIVDKELGFWNSSSSMQFTSPVSETNSGCLLGGKTAYFYIENKRVLGFCTVEPISKAFHLYPTDNVSKTDDNDNHESTSSRSIESSKAMLGVHQLWCHRSHRKKQIATMLVDIARSKFVYGLNVPLNMVAFSSPTSDGARFARKYGNTDKPLVYDCK